MRLKKQIQNAATGSDIDSAASRMQRELNNVPARASAIDVQRIVREELEMAVQNVRHRGDEAPRRKARSTILEIEEQRPAVRRARGYIEDVPGSETESEQSDPKAASEESETDEQPQNESEIETSIHSIPATLAAPARKAKCKSRETQKRSPEP